MTADFDDFAQPEPRARRARSRAAAPPAKSAPAGRRVGARFRALAHRYPLEVAITLVLTGAVGAVAYNALALQTSRHPAPFFGQGGKVDGPPPLPPVRPAMAPPPAASPLNLAVSPPAAAPVPLPAAPLMAAPPRPAPRDPIGDLIRGGDASAPQGPRATPARLPAAPGPAAPAARDPIADLIRLGGGAPPPPPALVGKPDPTRTVAAGQRALAKLGYGPMKADGLLGPETRQAIERFERERGLPVTGEFSGRTARELAAATGIAVE